MIGKHKTRAASFTLAHAGVLAVALVLAPLLGAQIEAMTAKTEMSTVDTRPVEKGPVIIRATLRTWWDCDTKDARDVDV